MKKIFFILFIALGFAVGISMQVEAGCNIVWSGSYSSGSIITSETSRTQQATQEAYEAIFANLYVSTYCSLPSEWTGSCYASSYDNDLFYCCQSACLDGGWHFNNGVYDAGPTCYYSALGPCKSGGGTWDVVCETTLIQLSSFTASPKSGEVVLSWSTESEIDNAGFNLYRAESENGEYIKVNNALIPAEGSTTQGAAYSFTDENVKNRKTYYYKLEDVDVKGISTLHGPVKAMPRLIYEIGK